MRYFITGATGFIGGKIVAQLILGGHDIIALVRNQEKGAALREHGVVTAMGDITDKDTMRDLMSETDGVFNVAAWYEIGVKTRGQMEKKGKQHTAREKGQHHKRKYKYTIHGCPFFAAPAARGRKPKCSNTAMPCLDAIKSQNRDAAFRFFESFNTAIATISG